MSHVLAALSVGDGLASLGHSLIGCVALYCLGRAVFFGD